MIFHYAHVYHQRALLACCERDSVHGERKKKERKRFSSRRKKKERKKEKKENCHIMNNVSTGNVYNACLVVTRALIMHYLFVKFYKKRDNSMRNLITITNHPCVKGIGQ
jgi:hypothetical protein